VVQNCRSEEPEKEKKTKLQQEKNSKKISSGRVMIRVGKQKRGRDQADKKTKTW